jgi:archaellum component FlaG (FlaF/FlaG flagellin family)
LVYNVDSSYVYTIEGNTSSTSGVVANGGGVYKKKYALNYSSISGYGRPNYDDTATTTTVTTPIVNTTTSTSTTTTTTTTVLKQGSSGTAVKELQ